MPKLPILISREEAIGMLERLSMSPAEAMEFLTADRIRRMAITKVVQERVKRQQNKFAPMAPSEGPPLPRFLAWLRWPWREE